MEKDDLKVLVGILTVSDSCASGEATDTSGQTLTKLIEGGTIPNAEVRASGCVSDDQSMIVEVLTEWTDNSKLHLIITTGGTGLAERDVTPEAVKQVIHREASGLSLLMSTLSLNVTPLAALARPVCGTRNKTLIVTLPGSAKAAQECLSFLSPVLPHALDLLAGRKSSVSSTHKHLQAQGALCTKDDMNMHHQDSYHHHHHNHHNHPRHDAHHQCSHISTTHQSHHQHVHPSSHCADTESKLSFSPFDKNAKSKAQVDKISRRPRKSPYPMISVAEAQEIVFSKARPKESITLPLSQAAGFVLATSITAATAVPPFPASIKDGYAVLFSDGAGRRTVLGGVAAGDGDQKELVTGSCFRINTGAPIPKGADAVVQVEDTELVRSSEDGCEELEIDVLVPPVIDQDIRAVGCDISRGTQVLSEGTTLGPAEIGLAASVGARQVTVYPMPLVGLLSTGNELVSAECEGVSLGSGEIYDSNLPTLRALLQLNHIPHTVAGAVKDTTQHLKQGIQTLLEKGVDVLVSTGGVSMGDKDILRAVLQADFSATIHFAQVFMKPGKPTTFATLRQGGREVLVLGLPGNPVSATVTANLYLLPLVRRMAGRQDYACTTLQAKLQHQLSLDPRPEYHRATVSFSGSDAVPLVTSTGSQLSSRLLSCARASALLVLPPATDDRKVLDEGHIVQAILL